VSLDTSTEVATSPEAPAFLLGPEAYLSPEWFDLEQRTLFADRWTLLASADELVEPGDYATGTVGRAPLVVVRGDDGTLRAFHNLCRHRGMVLLTGTGNVGTTINCFYHQWRYALDGSLTVVPQRREQFPGLENGDWGLAPAAVGEWEGMVFAHPDPDAPPLAQALVGVADHLGSHRPGLLAQVATVRLDMACNWKLFVENHVDIYHLWYLHRTTLGAFDHTRFSHWQSGGNWASYEPLRSDDPSATSLPEGTVPITHLDDRDRRGIGAHLLFPSHMLASSAGFFTTYVAVPVAPDRTTLEIRVRAEPGSDPGAAVRAVRAFIDEDVHACEQVQAGVASPRFAVGPLARDHERPIERFQGAVLAAMTT
jgi:Rieske 2Fe-2S family protein